MEKNGKVLIKYQLKQDYEYWVNPANLGHIDAPVEARPVRVRRQPGAPVKKEKTVPPAALNTVHIYTDGASSGNLAHPVSGRIDIRGKDKGNIEIHRQHH